MVTPQLACAEDIVVVVCADGTVRYLSADTWLDPEEYDWIEFQEGFQAIAVACCSASQIAVVGADGYIYTWSGSAWVQHDTIKKFKKVNYSLNDQTLYGIGESDDLLYNWNGSAWALTKGDSKDCLDISVPISNFDARVVDKSDGLAYYYDGAQWETMPESPECDAISYKHLIIWEPTIAIYYSSVHVLCDGIIKRKDGGWVDISHPYLQFDDIDALFNGDPAHEGRFWAVGHDPAGSYYAAYYAGTTIKWHFPLSLPGPRVEYPPAASIGDGLYLISRKSKLTPEGDYIARAIGSWYSRPQSASAADRPEFRTQFAPFYPLDDSTRTVYHENQFDAVPPRQATITNLRVTVVYYAINDYYWGGSSWIGSGHNHVQCTVTPYIRYNGTLYFGTPAQFGADNVNGHDYDPPADEHLTRGKTVYYDWATNPATSLQWSAEDRRKLSFGARIHSPSDNLGCCVIAILAARWDFTGKRSQSDEFEYVKLSPAEDAIVLTQHSQTPIKADDLDFTIEDAPPERSEIALIKDGLIVFHGIVWVVKDAQNGDYDILAKSQQITLNHRLLGQIQARGQITEVEPTPLTVADIFSSDTPDYVSYASLAHRDWYVDNEQLDDATWITRYAYNIPTGGLFYANSWLGEFKTARIIGDQASLEANDADTFIRAGTNDLAAYELPAIPDTVGVAATVFSDIYKNFGQEVRFRNARDGYVYMDAAVEIGRASTIQVIDGKNGTVTKRVTSSPNPTAAIGSSLNPKVSCAWARARQYFSKVFSSSKFATDLQEYLDSQIDVDDSLYDVVLPEEVWTLRPGDYIAVQPRNSAMTSARVRQIATGKGKTTILAGKRLLSLDEQFGVWRDAKYAEHQHTDLKTTEIDESTNLSISKQFTITSGDLANPGWQCKAMIAWDFVMQNLIYEGLDPDWAIIYRMNSNPAAPEAYIQVATESGSYDAYGTHEYEFYIYQNMEAVGVEPYGPNNVSILMPGKFKWRKDGGAWSDPITGYDIWHPTSDFNADLGNGLWGRVIFAIDPGGSPWMTPRYTNIAEQSASAYACQTIDLSAVPKCLMIAINGKPIPPGRYLARGEKDSMEVDITEFCNVAGTYTLSAEMVNGRAYSTYNNYYHKLSGRITQSCHDKPGAA